MRLIHTADLHLGFRQFNRVDDDGRNVRETDITGTFRALVDQVIALAPDLMVIGGDVMHVVRPSNVVVLEMFAEFRRLAEALPTMPIVMVAGNHDAPRSTDTACMLQLLKEVGVTVVDRTAQRVAFPQIGVSVLAVPDAPGMEKPRIDPDPAARFNVLLMHGEVQGMPGLRHEQALHAYMHGDMTLSAWDYVALGHYHVYQQLAPNMFYSGSIDYTSSNPWGELRAEAQAKLPGKGFIERDLVSGAHTFHALPRSRDHIDLATDAAGLSGAELSANLRELLDDAWPDGAIARVVITNCSTDVQRSVDQKLVREFKARALNLQLDYRRPEIRQFDASIPIRSIPRLPPLEDLLAARLKLRREDGSLSPDLSLEAITNLGRRYLHEAEEMARAKTGSTAEAAVA